MNKNKEMNIDNFSLLRDKLLFEEKGDFYFIQIFKRRKDNPDLSRSEKVIRSYHIESLEDYDKVKVSIVKECIAHNARAYIRLNRRNSRQVSLRMLCRLAEWQISGNHEGVHSLYNSICGEFHSEKNKTWVVDVDDETQLEEIEKSIRILQEKVEGRVTLYRVPTVNGWHLIASPFNKQVFRDLYPQVDIHTDNPSVLFYQKN